MLSGDNQPLLRTENLEKRYRRAGAGGGWEVRALDGVSLVAHSRTTTALVGESGSGKSTLALCLACLDRPTAGRIWFGGREVTAMSEEELRALRPQVQLVFQDPASSLNPRWTAAEIVSEPLLIQQQLGKNERRARAVALFEKVGLGPEKAEQRPAEFSGGQRQRLALARALALDPKLLILDEALSALDCSVQAQIVNLLLDLQASLGLTYLFITHDFALAAHLSDQIAVMEKGEIVEAGAVEELVRSPKHPATQRLIAATRGPQNSSKPMPVA